LERYQNFSFKNDTPLVIPQLIKQALHRRRRQPITEAEMQQMVMEEWERIPQEWINQLILKQEHWVHVLMERHGWSTPN
jgi:hypothetical protein